jgi:hypothetical protein
MDVPMRKAELLRGDQEDGVFPGPPGNQPIL